MIEVSVIIPFYGELDGLRMTLSALEKQTISRDQMEVLVVDNGSPHDLSSLEKEFVRVRWLREPKEGSYAARNHGLRHSKGAIVAFTDADCIPDPAWIMNGLAALKSSNAAIIGGRIEYLQPKDRFLNIAERIEEAFFMLAKQQFLIERLRVAATANLFALRVTFEKVGLFDGDLKSFGDGDWTRRATSTGEKLAYAPEALVRHPRRETIREIRRKWVRVAGGRISQLRKNNATWDAYLDAIVNDSWLDGQLHRTALAIKGLGFWRHLALLVAVECISFRITIEKLKVLIGGAPTRE